MTLDSVVSVGSFLHAKRNSVKPKTVRELHWNFNTAFRGIYFLLASFTNCHSQIPSQANTAMAVNTIHA